LTKGSISDQNVGVLIIGGGIIGLSIAYYLSLRDFSDVILVEKEPELCLHASGHNAGGIGGIFHGSQLMRPLVTETHRLYKELVETRSFDFDFERNGTISLDPSLDERATEARARSLEEEFRAPIGFLDSSDLKKREPNLSTEYIKCGLFYPDDAQGNSKKLGQCFEQECRNSGMEMETGAEILSFEVDRKRIERVKTSRGTYLPETVIITGGPWSGVLAKKFDCEIPVKPIKGHLITTEPSAKLIHSFIDGPNYYVMQTKPGNLVVGGGEADVGFDIIPDEQTIQEAWEEGKEMLPRLGSLKQEAKTACLRPYAPEGIPILGRSSDFTNVIFATGHYRNGFSLAPVTGKIISELIVDGETKIDITPFSPDRFSRKKGL
jgi:glycine/D-amino acid oxidase-like deaminating enzyme